MAENPVVAESKGLFKALFDFSFEHYVAVKFAKFIYGLLLVALGIGILAFIVTTLGNSYSGAATKLFMIVIVLPIGSFVYLVMLRIYMELLLVLFKIAEHTRRTAELLAGGAGSGPSVPRDPA